MDKNHILAEIKRIASANDGKAPGMAVFEKETGVARSDWFPELWLRWSDAVNEAGLAANQFQGAYSNEFLFEKYVALIRELGRIPIKGELLRKSKRDKTFPNEKAFYKNGKDAFLKQVIQYCHDHAGFDDVASLCDATSSKSNAKTLEKKKKVETGFVYLMRSGRHYKIGRTISVGSRERQLAVKIPIPPTTIHHIETDDPVGVEAYWHRRFAEKRGEGEWFDLSPEDISAFKRWKRIA